VLLSELQRGYQMRGEEEGVSGIIVQHGQRNYVKELGIEADSEKLHNMVNLKLQGKIILKILLEVEENGEEL
jgi:hypothetical protein